MFGTVWVMNNNCVHKTVFFHQFDMEIDLISIIWKAVEIRVPLLYRDQNLSHKVHISFHPNSPL